MENAYQLMCGKENANQIQITLRRTADFIFNV